MAGKKESPSLPRMDISGELMHSEDHAANALKKMKAYFVRENLCDVVLIAGIDGKRISAHRLVLSASSDFFEAMFTSSLKEASEKEITLGDVTGDVLQSLIQFCYTGSLELSGNTAEQLLSTACRLQLLDAVSLCCTFLKRQLDPSNCLGIALFADHLNCDSLMTVAMEYTHKHFEQVCGNQEFLQLNADILARLLVSDGLAVPSEEVVFNAVVAWMEHDSEARSKRMPELLPLIRLPLLPLRLITEHVAPLCISAGCPELVIEALTWQSMPTTRALTRTQRTNPRTSTEYNLLVFGERQNDIHIEIFDPRLNQWRPFHKLPTYQNKFCVALMGNSLFVYGRRDNYASHFYCLNLATMTWTELKPLNTNRENLCLAVLNEKLYVIGGTYNGFWNTVERWDPTMKNWSYVVPMSQKRASAGVAVLNGQIYVIGGSASGGIVLASMECFDPHKNSWSNKSPMNKPRRSFGVGVANGCIYAFGGASSVSYDIPYCKDTIECYNPVSDTWTIISNSSCAGRLSAGIAFLDGRLMVCGGNDGKANLNVVSRYNLDTDEWGDLPKPNLNTVYNCVAMRVNRTV